MRAWPERNLTPLEWAGKERPSGYECRHPAYKGTDQTKRAEELSVAHFLARFKRDHPTPIVQEMLAL